MERKVFGSQIAPPATPLQDFTYHWKQLMNFYASHETDCKVSIENTGIPKHLDRLLDILLEEEKRVDDTGPCLEYLLQHGLLDWLTTLAIVETPPGMRLVCYSFLKRLLARSKHPLLHHAPVHGPVQRLISQCNGNNASPIEAEEIQFLLTLCFLVCKYPQLTSIVNDSGLVKMEHQKRSRNESEKLTDLQSVTYVPTRKRNNSNPLFEPLNTQAVTLVNPNLFANDRQRRRSVCSEQLDLEKPINESRRNSRKHEAKITKRESLREFDESNSSKDTEFPSQSSSPLSLKNPPDCPIFPEDETTDFYDASDKRSDNRISLSYDLESKLQDLEDLRLDADFSSHDFATENDEKTSNLLTELPNREKSDSLLLDALISYVNSAVRFALFSLVENDISHNFPPCTLVTEDFSKNKISVLHPRLGQHGEDQSLRRNNGVGGFGGYVVRCNDGSKRFAKSHYETLEQFVQIDTSPRRS